MIDFILTLIPVKKLVEMMLPEDRLTSTVNFGLRMVVHLKFSFYVQREHVYLGDQSILDPSDMEIKAPSPT